MSYGYGNKSKKVLMTCHPDIGKVFNVLIKYIDVSLLEGIRTTKKQQDYFNDGKSKLDGVIKKSKHQGKEVEPELYEDYKNILEFTYNKHGEPIISFAIDATPYPIDFSNKHKKLCRFYYMAGMVISIAKDLYNKGEIEHLIRWGGDWDYDNNFEDQSFDDLPHFELYKPS